MAMSVLVTGGTGFMASHLVPALLEQGWRVRATGRRPRPDWMVRDVHYLAADLAGDEDLGGLLEGISHVVHLAGATSSRSSDEEMHRSNVVATERLLGAVAGAGLDRFLHMSSTSIYGEEVPLPQPVVETAEPHPSRGYGKAKWLTEQAVWQYAGKGVPVAVLRPVSVYGPGNTKLLASAILDAAIERYAGLGTLSVHRAPVELRLLHIDDLVGAVLHLLGAEGAAGRAFNLCSGVYPTSLEVAGVAAKHLGMELAPDPGPECGLPFEERRAVHARMLAAGMRDAILLTPDRFRLMRKENPNNRLSLAALASVGYVPRVTDLDGSVGRAIEWYLAARWIV